MALEKRDFDYYFASFACSDRPMKLLELSPRLSGWWIKRRGDFVVRAEHVSKIERRVARLKLLKKHFGKPLGGHLLKAVNELPGTSKQI